MAQKTTSSPPYVPSQKILRKYAELLVNFALNSGKGVKKGEVISCSVPDVAKSLGLELQNAILRAGAQPYLRLLPTGFEKDFFTFANDKQLSFFPENYLKAKADLIDHHIAIIADPDPHELAGIDPKKFMLARNSKKPYGDLLRQKEIEGKYTWTCGLWAVQAKADIVGLKLEEYWQQIIKACFLDKADPIAEWKKIFAQQEKTLKRVNALPIEWVHVKGPDVDLKLKIGKDRAWFGGSGRNIPSFEIFTSPDWRGSEGWITFNQPVYRYGQVLEGVTLKLEKGLVTKATAKKGQKFLLEMLKTKNANKIGEFSLTDKRLSRITHVMAETLYDENISGPHGNTHLAVGMAFKDCYRGDASCVTEQQWEAMGFNDSAEHTDIISTTERVVTATLTDGTQKIIYRDGMWVV